MPAIIEPLRRNLAYLFIVAGAIWAGLLYLTSAGLLVWPAAVCVVAGVLLKARPKARYSWAWVTAAGLMGLVLAGYQAAASTPLLAGAFAPVAAASLVAFLAFAAMHALLLYATTKPATTAE